MPIIIRCASPATTTNVQVKGTPEREKVIVASPITCMGWPCAEQSECVDGVSFISLPALAFSNTLSALLSIQDNSAPVSSIAFIKDAFACSNDA